MNRLLLLAVFASTAIGQTGPGGVGTTDGTSSLKLWLDAAASSTITESGGSISAWNDKSGNSNHATQSTASKKPTYQTNQINGNAAILFDESDDILTVSSSLITGTTDFHLIAAIKRGSLPSTPADAIMGNYDVSANELVMYVGGGAGTHANRLWYGGGNVALGSTDVSNGTAAIFAGKRSGGSATIYTNSTSDGSGTNSTSIPSGSNWTIGNYTSSTSDAFKGHIAELLVFNVALKEAERILIDNYLSAKWNITLTANDKYVGNDASYINQLIGIGKESDGSSILAQSGGLVLTENAAFIAGEYLLAGHNNGTGLTALDVTASVTKRWSRVWYFDKTSVSTSTIKIAFDLGDYGGGTPATAANYRLLYRSGTTGNFSEAATGTSIVSTDQVEFSVATNTVADGYYTLGTINEGASPLPVELVSFNALAKGNSAQLSWATATETNNYGFEIERIPLGFAVYPFTKEDNGRFQKVGFIEGAGTTNSPRDYSFVDNNLRNGTYDYRLKQIDRDGKFEYSQKVEVTIAGAPQVFALMQNYPNPFNPSTTIEFTLPEDGKVTLKVYDVLGKVVATLVDGELKAGSVHRATFDASRISSGIYFFRLQHEGKQLMKKLLVMK
jgi:hypothetical protein